MIAIILAMLPFIEALIELLANLTSASQLTATQRPLVARFFNKCDKVRGHAIRIGLPFTSSEVQNAP